MQISATNGRLFVGGKEVLTIVFTDGQTMSFPDEQLKHNSVYIDHTAHQNTAKVTGMGNTAISGKNIIAPGSVIQCKGDFKLGDG